ncbi:MAG: hypothetical protein GY705_09085 [Bacteroidetes bacterium]|nr:hypothetical protein [Bacteroidota bacterium]
MMEKAKKTPKNKIAKDSDLTNIRARVSFKESINSEVSKLNKRKKGSKKIIPADILEILLPLLTDEHREQLLSKTVTGSDRRKRARQGYIKKHGSISEIAFLDLIQDREVELDDYLPEELKLQNLKGKKSLTKVNKNVNLEEKSA